MAFKWFKVGKSAIGADGNGNVAAVTPTRKSGFRLFGRKVVYVEGRVEAKSGFRLNIFGLNQKEVQDEIDNMTGNRKDSQN